MRIALAVAVMMAGAAAETRAGAETGAGGASAAAETTAGAAAETTAGAAAETAAGGASAAAERTATRCTASEVRAAVKGFVAELNRGDLRALNRRFSPASRFQWYSTPAPGERFDDVAEDRASLIPYFKGRHREHERLTLRRFQFNGAAAAEYGNFEFTLTRRADDLKRPARYAGKGAAWCHKGSRDEIFVWSMGSGG